MRRRACIAAAAALLAACGAAAQPSYRISAAQVQQAVAQRFPVNKQLGGLLDLQVQAPALRFMGQRNRLGAEVPLQLGGPALRRSYAGAFDLDFALRYEASDRTIRAHQVKVNALRVPDAPPEVQQLLAGYLPQLANQALGEVVLHQVEDKDLQLADTMGLAPDTITVTDRGLVVGFAPKK